MPPVEWGQAKACPLILPGLACAALSITASWRAPGLGSMAGWMQPTRLLPRNPCLSTGRVRSAPKRPRMHGSPLLLLLSFGMLIQINLWASFLINVGRYRNKHPQQTRLEASGGREYRGEPRSLSHSSPLSDAIARLAVPGAAMSTILIDAERLGAGAGEQFKCHVSRPCSALMHKSAGARACPADSSAREHHRRDEPPLSPPAVGSHVSSRRALATAPLAPSHQPFMPLSPFAPQPSSAAAQASVPLRKPHQGLQRQRFLLSTILTKDHRGTGNDHNHTREW